MGNCFWCTRITVTSTSSGRARYSGRNSARMTPGYSVRYCHCAQTLASIEGAPRTELASMRARSAITWRRRVESMTTRASSSLVM